MANAIVDVDSGSEAVGSGPGCGFRMLTSRGFVEWLARERLSLAVTTYQRGGLFLLGTRPGPTLGLWAAAFGRAMGLHATDQTIWMATATALRRFENDLPPGRVEDGFDRVYVPRVGYTTGDLDVHDLAVDADGRPVFVATRFGCLATVSDRFSFEPVWKPPFLSALVPEDRCHLNGLALEDGRPKYVTMVGTSDVADGWREHRVGGGLVMDVSSNEIICRGLSMPHSPRQIGGKIWLLEAGTGHLGFVDPSTGRFEEVCFLPGFARGLAISGRFAVVGTSMPRRDPSFEGLPLGQNLRSRSTSPRCGLHVIDLESGSVVHWLRFEGPLEELYDVAVLASVVRPKALSFSRRSTVGHRIRFEAGDQGPRHFVPVA
ncbi:TIGR03032 family protein [Tautonia marina]|uniref:TIGR03032 family protein n=1 Tax=Tautonia marina TaxID=2653855 RepID=UPI00191BEF14|nr:TIGR03032 family protein [Tautonia marina]